jgi:surface protein
VLSFNQTWDVSTTVTEYVEYCLVVQLQGSFNQDIGSWDVSNVTVMNVYVFKYFPFLGNQDISGWDVSSVYKYGFQMFINTSAFNQDISGWDVSSVTNMFECLVKLMLLIKILAWDTSSVTNMNGVFDVFGGGSFQSKSC